MKVVKYILGTIVIIMCIAILVIFNRLSNIEIRDTKDYATMYIIDEDVVDANVIINPPEKYDQLLQIDLKMRKQLAQYMIDNDFRLQSGAQTFVRNNPSLDELKKDLKFQKKEEDK